MADIELVIKIDEKLYKDIYSDAEIMIYGGMRSGKTLLATLLRAIRKGTPLPKEHGRLIDADELYGDFIDGTEGYDCQTWNRIEIGDVIEDARTIIEADKGEADGK